MKAPTRGNYRILITDDDVGCRETLRDIVEPEGFQTLLASSGEEAVDLVRELPIHLALLDMHLPRMNGLEALRLMHQINSALPCILVTADATESLMRQAIQAQAYSILHKPVSKGVVLYTVVRALGRFYGGERGSERTTRDEDPGRQ